MLTYSRSHCSNSSDESADTTESFANPLFKDLVLPRIHDSYGVDISGVAIPQLPAPSMSSCVGFAFAFAFVLAISCGGIPLDTEQG